MKKIKMSSKGQKRIPSQSQTATGCTKIKIKRKLPSASNGEKGKHKNK
jgi:hypothetical protein